jgi:predicted unusual protein kinase regulating ubiquinone biosynthesis (AarF/ABC1/UbiB family)
VLVSEWVDGTPLATVIRDGERADRNRAGYLLSEFHYSAPARAGLLHADPHPGNFMVVPDGRMCVIDFGGVAQLPEGLPPTLGWLMRSAVDGDSEKLFETLREEGFVPPGAKVPAEHVYAYLAPFVEPLRTDTFHFTRRWMQQQAERLGDLGGQDFRTGRSLNLPPQYLMIQRVLTGSTGILCQLDAEVPAREIVERWQPGFAE